MGLESYAFVTATSEGDLDKAQDFYYWRKHYDLVHWAKVIAKEKGAEIEETEDYCNFSIQLEPSDIDRLEAEVLSKLLYTEKTRPDRQHFQRLCDIDFISKARIAFKAGLDVFLHFGLVTTPVAG